MLYIILILNLFSSFFLCGLIWMVQLVHYPMFYHLDKTNFSSHIAFHGFRISFIVIPLMITELITSFALVYLSAQYFYFHFSGLIAVIIIWLTTFMVQVPLHKSLSQKRNKYMIHKLIRSNIIRTTLWSVKSLLGAVILYQILT